MILKKLIRNDKGTKHTFIVIFKIIFSLCAIIFIFRKVDFHDFLTKFTELPFLSILILLITLFLQVLSNTLIKNTMLSVFGFKEKWIILFQKILIGSFFGSLMPSMIGGDAYYLYHFGRKYNSYTKIAGGILLIRTIGLIVFFLIVIAVLPIIGNNILSNYRFSLEKNKILFFLVILFLTGAFLLFIFNKFFKLYIAKVRNKLIEIKDEVFQNRKRIYRLIIYSGFYYMFSLGGRALLARTIGIDLSLVYLIGIISIVNLLIMIPISINGIGMREGGYVAVMSLFHIKKEIALKMALLDFSMTILAILIGAILYSINKRNQDFDINEVRKSR